MTTINDHARNLVKRLLMGPRAQYPIACPDLKNPGPKVALLNCRVFDGISNRLLSGQTLLVKGNRLVSIGPAEKTAVPEGYFPLDLAGGTVMPGLIDAHVHLCSPFTYEANLAAVRQLRKQLRLNHLAMIGDGVTTVCDMGGPPGLVREFRELLEEGKIPGPRPQNCFTMISPRRGQEMGYPTQVKPLGTFQSWLIEGQVSTRPKSFRELRDVCYKIRDENGSHLKITYQQHSFSAMQEPAGLPLFGDDWMKEIFRISRDAGMLVSIHAPFLSGCRKCVDLAVETGAKIRLQHICCDGDLDRPLLERMRDHGLFLIPTVMVYGDAFRLAELLDRLEDRSGVSLAPEARKQLQGKVRQLADLEPLNGQRILEVDTVFFRRQFDQVRRNTQKAHAAGVIGFGTDMGGTYTGFFGRLRDEIQHYADFGISPADIAKYLTSVNAGIHQLDDRGTLSPGKLADLVVLEGNPLEDPLALSNIRAVMKDGRFLKFRDAGQLRGAPRNDNPPRSTTDSRFTLLQ